MRLGFHYHVPALELGNRIYMPGQLGRFVDTLAAQMESLVCFMHTPKLDEVQFTDYPLRARNVKLIGLGPHSSVLQRMLNRDQVKDIIRPWRDGLDAMLIRGPSPLLPWVARAVQPLPSVLLLVGDQLAGVEGLPQPRWRKEAIRAFWIWNNRQQLAIAKRSLTIVNSHLLYRELEAKVANLAEIRTTTLEKSDFYDREDTCLTRPVRLLYTGRMDRAKGLMEMVSALAILAQRGHDCILDLVGMVISGDPILVEIQQKARELNVSERTIYHGYRTLGRQLFDFYRKADIYLIASQSSEGFPRAIWEAMAYSLPVVATHVGSIPAFVDGVAELVAPRSPLELADGISRVIEDGSRRRHMISEGRKLARENTLERRAREMVATMNVYVAKVKSGNA